MKSFAKECDPVDIEVNAFIGLRVGIESSCKSGFYNPLVKDCETNNPLFQAGTEI